MVSDEDAKRVEREIPDYAMTKDQIERALRDMDFTNPNSIAAFRDRINRNRPGPKASVENQLRETEREVVRGDPDHGTGRDVHLKDSEYTPVGPRRKFEIGETDDGDIVATHKESGETRTLMERDQRTDIDE